ncbi:MAG: Xaa-Pro peptidase family protein [Planctomycetota bacterium]
MTEQIEKRLGKARSKLRQRGLDALLVTHETNVRYLSAFTGDSSAVILARSDAVFITDSRYTEQAGDECDGFEIVTRRGSMLEAIAARAGNLGLGNLGVEGHVLTLESAERLRDELGRVEMIRTSNLVEALRERKTKEEVDAIRSCIDAAERCLEHVRGYLVPGIRERDVLAEMEYFVRGLGFDGMAFPPIVAFGPRGSLPHARAGDRRMAEGDPVLIDWGVASGGYCSDLTRVFFHHKIPGRFERIYRTVLKAQERAIRKIGPGVPAREVDAAARDCIQAAGFGKRFGHGLGHGIGMDVHEAPTVGPRSDAELRRRMVFTVEPGIYVPGVGGVRIEDDVLVTSRGVDVLSDAPKGLDDLVL